MIKINYVSDVDGDKNYNIDILDGINYSDINKKLPYSNLANRPMLITYNRTCYYNKEIFLEKRHEIGQQISKKTLGMHDPVYRTKYEIIRIYKNIIIRKLESNSYIQDQFFYINNASTY